MKLETELAHKELFKYQFYKRKMKPLQDKIRMLRLKSTMPKGSVYDHIRGSNPETMESLIANLVDLELEYLKKFNEIERKSLEIEKKLEELPDIKESEVLSLYYCNGNTLEEIAVLLKKDFKTIFTRKKNGLLSYYNKYLQEEI